MACHVRPMLSFTGQYSAQLAPMRKHTTMKKPSFQGSPESTFRIQCPNGARCSASHCAYCNALHISTKIEPRGSTARRVCTPAHTTHNINSPSGATAVQGAACEGLRRLSSKFSGPDQHAYLKPCTIDRLVSNAHILTISYIVRQQC